MSLFHKNTLLGASGAGDDAAAAGLYVEDVFSCNVWNGSGSARNIVNGIDLENEGGMVWYKARTSTSYNHDLYDTERGAGKYIHTNLDNKEATNTTRLSAFNDNGFSLGGNSNANGNNQRYVGWTFRKAPGFFDVVTYPGTGTAQNISHSLGSVPGAIWIKCTSASGSNFDWAVYHRTLNITGGKSLTFHNPDLGLQSDSTVFDSTEATSSVFTVGTSSKTNQNGKTYVAYIFAHDDQQFGDNGDEAIIKCDEYTGTGTTTGNEVDLGFEPQWLIIKKNSTADWVVYDSTRGLTAKGGDDNQLRPNKFNLEDDSDVINITPTGFQPVATSGFINSNGAKYHYIAIRRPHKPITTATELFSADAAGINASAKGRTIFEANHKVDLVIHKNKNSASGNVVAFDRLRGGGRC